MKILAILFPLLLLPQSAGAINYFRCEQTKDCTKTYGGCGRYLAVHKRYGELYAAKAHKGDRVANCLPPTQRDKNLKHQGQPLCVKKRCALKIPRTEPKRTKSS